MRKMVPMLILTTMAVAACGGGPAGAGDETTTTEAPTTTLPPHEVLRADLVGGCFMMGPNCARYVIFSDGTVEVHRLVDETTELLWVAAIDEALVTAVSDELATTDLEELRARLGPGTCNACVDGIDTILVFSGGGVATEFDSADVELDPSEPLFAAASAAVDAAVATGEVPIVTR